MTAGCCTAPWPAPPPPPGLQDRAGFLACCAWKPPPARRRPPPAPARPGATAPVPPPAPAPAAASNDFTVYFDFDSWTLKAEQLKVLDDVIATARSGGQSNIIIVGHTDTSGPADYNQKLSVKPGQCGGGSAGADGCAPDRAACQRRRRNRPGGPDRRQRQGSQEPPHRHHAAAVTNPQNLTALRSTWMRARAFACAGRRFCACRAAQSA